MNLDSVFFEQLWFGMGYTLLPLYLHQQCLMKDTYSEKEMNSGAVKISFSLAIQRRNDQSTLERFDVTTTEIDPVRIQKTQACAQEAKKEFNDIAKKYRRTKNDERLWRISAADSILATGLEFPAGPIEIQDSEKTFQVILDPPPNGVPRFPSLGKK